MLMYDVDQRDAERKKARREKDEMSQEMKELKKLKETEQLYQREERKLFLEAQARRQVLRVHRHREAVRRPDGAAHLPEDLQVQPEEAADRQAHHRQQTAAHPS